AVKLAAVMHKLSMTGGKEFESSSPWYQTYVKYAKSVGIINKDYEWNEAATRAGYIEIFANAIPESPALDGVKGLDAVNSVPDGLIPDVPMSHPQAASIYKLYRAGILQGNDSKHSCKPDSNIRRSEVAAVLNRMMNADARISFSIEPEPLVISLPESLSGKADKQISIPATATGGTGPYSYEWFFAKTPGSTWLPSAEESSTYTSKFVYVDKLYCKCKVTDSAGNTAESNICEITLTK
ncbi:MAG: SprB repeat-containing protein, partial [Oscillospiraceae bacterium]|nr:SprB repeat-containing protein [Oscillospiraceae bacterium]